MQVLFSLSVLLIVKCSKVATTTKKKRLVVEGSGFICSQQEYWYLVLNMIICGCEVVCDQDFNSGLFSESVGFFKHCLMITFWSFLHIHASLWWWPGDRITGYHHRTAKVRVCVCACVCLCVCVRACVCFSQYVLISLNLTLYDCSLHWQNCVQCVVWTWRKLTLTVGLSETI